MHTRPRGTQPIDPVVFWISAAIALAFIAWGVLSTDNLGEVATSVLDYVITNFGWVFVLSTFGFLIFAAFLAVSRFGKIRLGRDDEKPEFRTASWVAMMFSAGMGIGLMFYGVAEPLSHMGAPPFGAAPAGSKEAARVAMEYSYFHWAFHPWALYAVVGLSLAYFVYRKGNKNLISSAFRPILGDRVEGPIGRAIDILAIFATLFGSATSLGLGALQINSGMNFLWGVETSDALAVTIIAVLTLAFVLSAVSGVAKGIQWLSNGNMVLAGLLLLFLLIVGPTVFIFDTFTEALGTYITGLVPNSFRTGAYGDAEWLSAWTIFYWAWWISWAPFVGTFIARISRGRTIRQFVVGVLLVPSGVSFVWFAILGGAAIDLQLTGAADIAAAVGESPEAGLFTTLEQFTLSDVTSLIVIILVALFFVSGADAASLVMGMLSTRGSLAPPRPVVIFWGGMTGAAAAVLLLAGGLSALQQAAIIAAAPFVLVMIGLCVCLAKALARDQPPPEPVRAPREEAAPVPATAPRDVVPTG
ncbi:MAG TPA: BCCT family transporter [Solirubrobacteraceae bacterium]|nr:BCCT family transporter [Solirubrobacteraceae bacterium]